MFKKNNKTVISEVDEDGNTNRMRFKPGNLNGAVELDSNMGLSDEEWIELRQLIPKKY